MPKRLRLTTPPRELIKTDDAPPQLDTPRRSAILALVYFNQEENQPCSLQRISTVFGIHPSTISRVVASGRCRQLQHSDAPDTRGRPRGITNADAEAISTYIRDAPFDEKSFSWQDIAEKAGVVKEYRHERGARNLQWHPKVIQRHVTQWSGIKTHKAVTKEAHSLAQVRWRAAYINTQITIRPNAQHWRNVLWCDEVHWMTGPRYPRNIKRPPGTYWKYHPSNIQYDPDHKPDAEKQSHFHVFCVVGFDFAWALPYSTRATNGKMNTKTYTEFVLPKLQAFILEKGGDWILWQDRDSAHTSKETLRWMELHGLDYILSPPKSPDLSVMETWVSPIRRDFWQQRCATKAQGLRRFHEIWRALNQEKINKTVDGYPLRLQEVRDKYQYRASRF